MPSDGSRANGDRSSPTDSEHASARNRMVDRLQTTRRITRPETAAAMRAVPRHAFVPGDKVGVAYADRPLGIGVGQTISAPHMVGMMTDLLELSPGHRVLEIGTGCGYHAAVTAEIVGAEHVYSVEYHASLADAARETLDACGYGAISVRVGDGYDGWPEHAPYDRAYLTCAPTALPEPVLEQVPDGIVVGPVGDTRQELVQVRRRAGETVDRGAHGGVRFVTMNRG